GQGFEDLELIAVDDCSPDGSGAILAEYAARDPRVRVLSLPANVGLGRARNAGLDAATGEYVWFVDSDDWLSDRCMHAVARRLAEVKPDVLIVDQQRVYWDGRVRRSHLAPAFAGAPEVFTALENRRVLRVLHVAWNKIVRREFLLGTGVRFQPGWYEDVSFTYPLLVAAGRISVLDRVCVNYRQRRIGAITRTVGERHFELFDHWERVFALLDEWGPAVDALRPAVFARMVWHYLIVLGNGNRVPRAARRRFFERAAEGYARHLPPGGYRMPGGAEGLKHRLLARRAWRTFSALRVGVRVRKRVVPPARRAAGRVKRAGWAALRQGRLLVGRGYYAVARRVLPVDPGLAVYAAYWYQGYACNPAAVYERAGELAPGVRGVWAVRRRRRGSVPAGVPYVVAGGLRYFHALARARFLVNNVNFPGYVVKRRGTVHLQTHHGTPLKVMGLEEGHYPAGQGADYAERLRRSDRWDFSVSANPLSTEAFLRQYPCAYEVLEYGYPRNDRLVTADAGAVAAARSAVGAQPGDLVALYVPTHRRHHPGYQPPFDAEDVAEALGPRGRLLVRAHYLEDGRPGPPGGRPPAGGRVVDVTGHARVAELYLAADLLITDYSSAMFDYALLDRPIVIYAPDWAAYRAVRGVTFDVLAQPPGAVARTLDELIALLRGGEFAADAAGAARAEFRRRFCPWDDGRAAERVVRRVLLGEQVPGRPGVAAGGPAAGGVVG
ncbi:MAG TPA: bifunctional glycosyltransferase family 2 protein/CDP-glycerol:glycerophosphate glycerophosphotransferase, partial [Pilimelia sp.]|nr:bifunctional glycosyltransferase family 2 protein/CDP-glycerol:glycerophosphate glycerophosphotransferase [Pilimelia sp.]